MAVESLEGRRAGRGRPVRHSRRRPPRPFSRWPAATVRSWLACRRTAPVPRRVSSSKPCLSSCHPWGRAGSHGRSRPPQPLWRRSVPIPAWCTRHLCGPNRRFQRSRDHAEDSLGVGGSLMHRAQRGMLSRSVRAAHCSTDRGQCGAALPGPGAAQRPRTLCGSSTPRVLSRGKVLVTGGLHRNGILGCGSATAWSRRFEPVL